ncbi:MAG: UDP-N-acetylmuramate:L-alanyl-gamma-D-glutamyl-meso-diaminopimelate ligase [Bdellovibrio sp.]
MALSKLVKYRDNQYMVLERSNSSPVPALKHGAHIHLIGICGTAMASLAGLLQSRGYLVTGSDSNPYPPMSTQLTKLGIAIRQPYRAENLNPRPDFVIVGNVISRGNPEAQELLKLGIPYTSLPRAMGEWIIGEKTSVVVAGTHGKTTTTSLLSWVLTHARKNPGFLIGGIPRNFDLSFRATDGDLFVIEGDEYDTAFFDKVPKFVHYRPKHVILTSVEFDHADIYRDLEHVKSAFRQLLQLIPQEGTLTYWSGDPNIRSILSDCHAQMRPYSEGEGEGLQWVGSRDLADGSVELDLRSRGEQWSFRTRLTGTYNYLNLMAVWSVVQILGVAPEVFQSALDSFEGVKRRQEILGEPRGVLVIEDFAHHPTAVRETLKGLRRRYPHRKLFAVFEPRSATSRRKIFQKDYVQAFIGADRVFIAEAFDQSKIQEQDRFSSAELVEDLRKQCLQAEVFSSVDRAVQLISKEARSGNMVVIMSNGGFDGIYGKILSALSGGGNGTQQKTVTSAS